MSEDRMSRRGPVIVTLLVGLMLSMMPLPEKPRLTVSQPSRRPTTATCAVPGREAQAPWVIEVP